MKGGINNWIFDNSDVIKVEWHWNSKTGSEIQEIRVSKQMVNTCVDLRKDCIKYYVRNMFIPTNLATENKAKPTF